MKLYAKQRLQAETKEKVVTFLKSIGLKPKKDWVISIGKSQALVETSGFPHAMAVVDILKRNKHLQFLGANEFLVDKNFVVRVEHNAFKNRSPHLVVFRDPTKWLPHELTHILYRAKLGVRKDPLSTDYKQTFDMSMKDMDFHLTDAGFRTDSTSPTLRIYDLGYGNRDTAWYAYVKCDGTRCHLKIEHK